VLVAGLGAFTIASAVCAAAVSPVMGHQVDAVGHHANVAIQRWPPIQIDAEYVPLTTTSAA
jgi:hypothetical protein